MIDVLVLGDLNPDLVLRGDVVPRFGQAEQLLNAATLVLGGSAAIMAHALARLGRPTRLGALIGDDNLGDIVVGLLTAEGVDTQAVIKDPGRPTGLTVVLSQGQERAVLTFPGTIAGLSVEQALAALEGAAADGARHVHVSSLFLQPSLAAGLAAVFERAHTLGLSASLDPNFDPAQRWEGVEELLPHLNVFLPNRSETLAIAERIAGQSFDDVAAAGSLLASRGPVVVITDGRNGALQVNPDGSQLHDPGDPVDAIDTTGAGDTFVGAFAAARCAGTALTDAVNYGQRAAAWSVTRAGAMASMPRRDELDLPQTQSL